MSTCVGVRRVAFSEGCVVVSFEVSWVCFMFAVNVGSAAIGLPRWTLWRLSLSGVNGSQVEVVVAEEQVASIRHVLAGSPRV